MHFDKDRLFYSLGRTFGPTAQRRKRSGGMAKRYYKAIPKQFYASIKATGLDPSKAGQIGGATAMNIAVRQPTKYDKNYTWLGPYHQALDYAQDKFVHRDPLIIRIEIPEEVDFNMSKMIDRGGLIKIKGRNNGGFTTKQLIPPCYISVQTAKGDNFANVAAIDNPYIITEKDQDIEDDW